MSNLHLLAWHTAYFYTAWICTLPHMPVPLVERLIPKDSHAMLQACPSSEPSYTGLQLALQDCLFEYSTTHRSQESTFSFLLGTPVGCYRLAEAQHYTGSYITRTPVPPRVPSFIIFIVRRLVPWSAREIAICIPHFPMVLAIYRPAQRRACAEHYIDRALVS